MTTTTPHLARDRPVGRSYRMHNYLVLAAALLLSTGCPDPDANDAGDGEVTGSEDDFGTDTETGDPGDGDGDGEPGDGDGDGDATGDGDGDMPCPEIPPVDCDETGRCWTIRDGWEAEAQTTTMESIEEAVALNILRPVEGNAACWEYGTGTDIGHTCVVELVDECALLVGRPTIEVELLLGSTLCDLAGPWSVTVTDSPYSHCWGVFDELEIAVRLRP
jgi:hypothetical protein